MELTLGMLSINLTLGFSMGWAHHWFYVESPNMEDPESSCTGGATDWKCSAKQILHALHFQIDRRHLTHIAAHLSHCYTK